MKEYKIRIHNEEHSKAVQDRLFAMGYNWLNSLRTTRLTDKNFLFTYKDGAIAWDNSVMVFSESDKKEVTLDELFTEKISKTIKLNDEYTAEIKDGFIKVGCQKIDFEKIEELYSAIKKHK